MFCLALPGSCLTLCKYFFSPHKSFHWIKWNYVAEVGVAGVSSCSEIKINHFQNRRREDSLTGAAVSPARSPSLYSSRCRKCRRGPPLWFGRFSRTQWQRPRRREQPRLCGRGERSGGERIRQIEEKSGCSRAAHVAKASSAR